MLYYDDNELETLYGYCTVDSRICGAMILNGMSWGLILIVFSVELENTEGLLPGDSFIFMFWVPFHTQHVNYLWFCMFK